MLLTVDGTRWLMAAHGSGRRLYPCQLHMFWNLLLDKTPAAGSARQAVATGTREPPVPPLSAALTGFAPSTWLCCGAAADSEQLRR